MNKKIVIAVMLSLALVYFGGCKKKEQQPVPKAPAMPQGMGVLPQGQAAPQGHQMMSGGKLEVVVPKIIKGKWSSVKLLVEEKDTKK
ncbi:MAG: hypothetical protein L6245_02930, partial [Thermodesulfovibrionales bacterium]|nr:hypothetical protein [Thermodesulfovibrionales bacterium]